MFLEPLFSVRRIRLGMVFWLCLTIMPTVMAAPFEISPDGTEVTDTRTGLIWRRCPEGLAWRGDQCVGYPLFVMWYEALQHAHGVAISSGLPWRVPNVKELATLLDRQQSAQAIDLHVFPNTMSDHYWTSTTYASDSFFGWVVHFYFGSVYFTYLEDMGGLRLVRDPVP